MHAPGAPLMIQLWGEMMAEVHNIDQAVVGAIERLRGAARALPSRSNSQHAVSSSLL